MTVFVEEQPLNALTDLTFDPDASRQLLAESGYPDGFPATLLYPEEDQKLAEVAAQIAEDLNQIGVEVVVEAEPIRKKLT